MRFIIAALVVLLQASPPARAEGNAPFSASPYFDSKVLDLTLILPPPPALDSVETRAELGELLAVQVTRTPDMVSRAQADAVEEVWRFADVMGPKFTPAALPKTAALFDRLVATDSAVVDPAKASFNRARPHLVSELVKPVVRLSNSGSWPSSHASVGTLMGIVLGDMVPEKRAAIMERARTYAENRLVAGMHFPSDVEMGRIAGSVIAAVAMRQSQFAGEYEGAKAELRAVLGL